MSDRPLVKVAAAVIVAPDGRILLAQRPAGKVYAGYWEFPGGKLEPGESPRHALDRELREELGLTVRRAAPWLIQRYAYPHANVELHFFRVFAFEGQPVGHDGQAFTWQTLGDFNVGPLLPANAPVLRALALPAVYGISMAEELGEAVFLERARRAFARGLRLMQVREREWPLARQRALTHALLEAAAPFGARVLLNGSADDARSWGCHGVHWNTLKLAEATERPADILCAASCHDVAGIARAAALRLDFAVLGPVRPTPSHPRATPIGWPGFAEALASSTLPVFALGGLSATDLDQAMDHGAHGVALRRAAWPVSDDGRG